jgi:hypothetical protein
MVPYCTVLNGLKSGFLNKIPNLTPNFGETNIVAITVISFATQALEFQQTGLCEIGENYKLFSEGLLWQSSESWHAQFTIVVMITANKII